MENAFIHVLSSNEYNDIASLLKLAIEYQKTDPQASIMKVALIVEMIVKKIVYDENLHPQYSDLAGNIESLKGVILDKVIKDMHSIRIIRNSGAAHVSYSKSSQDSDKTESLYSLKKIYDILSWYVNYKAKKVIAFMSFDEYISINDSEVTKDDIKKVDSIDIPIFYIDHEIEVKYTDKPIDLLDEKDIMKVFELFLTTSKNLKAIEEAVFHNEKANGDLVYAIIMLYKSIGLTNIWRKYVQKQGFSNTIAILDIQIKTEPDQLTLEKYLILKSILQKIKR